MKTFIFNRTILLLLFSILVSSVNVNLDAKVKKRRSSTKQTSTSAPEGYSKTLVDMAKAGNVDAQAYLGMCYEQGNGVQKDESKALYWYDKAASQGNAYAQAYSAMMYLQGRGTEVDEQKAFRLAQSSANQSNMYGQYILGTCYYYGLGVGADIKSAYNWLMKSYNQGVDYAREPLDEILADEDLAFQATYESQDWNTDSKAWAKAKSLNTAVAYENYLELYPSGTHYTEANDAYIDKLINKTNQGDYIPLPEATKVESSYGTEASSDISNDTPFKIEIVFSGPEKKRVIIPARTKKVVTLKKGRYEIVTKAPGQRVTPYYGKHNYDGNYTEKYYLEK